MKFCYRAAMLLACSMVLAACSSTSLYNSWRDPEYRKQVHSVYVVGVTHVNINRYRFEDAVSRELQARGVTALPSYKDGEFPVETDDQTIAERAAANGVDSVLMARVLGQDSGQSGYKIATLEVALYEAGTGKAVWSAQCEVIFDRRNELLLSDIAKAVASDLQKNGLL